MKSLSRINDRTLINRIMNLRKDPPFIIFQTILDKATWRSLQVRRFFFLFYNGVPEVRNPRGPGEVRKGMSSDVDGMAGFENKKELFSRRFSVNDHCIVAVANGKIVGYEWFTDKSYHIEERYRYKINIPADSVYAYDAYISPEYRMCGFWLKFKMAMAGMMRQLGRHRIITMIDYENSISMNTHLRFGFIPFKNILVIRVLGKNFFRENKQLHCRNRLLTHG